MIYGEISVFIFGERSKHIINWRLGILLIDDVHGFFPEAKNAISKVKS